MTGDRIDATLLDYERWERYCAYTGGGLGGILLFGDLAKDSFEAAPFQLRGAFIATALMAGVVLGWAYFTFVTARTQLVLYQKVNQARDADSVPDSDKKYRFPDGAVWAYRVALAIIGAAAIILVVAAWSPVPACPPPKK